MSAHAAELARRIAREAAQWLVLRDAGGLGPEQAAALQHWRALSEAHEAAWQRAEALRQRFAGLPAPLALASLDRPDLGRRRALKQVLGLATLAPAAWLAYRQAPVASWRADLRTATGERRDVDLPGGGRLHLNTASAVNLGPGVIELVAGEIAVETPGPLRVERAEGRLLTDAARFCVRQLEAGCLVSVEAGTVRLHPATGQVVALSAGQRAGLLPTGITPVTRFDPEQPDWRQGVLIVENRPLGTVLRELDRYRPGLLRWDAALEALPVTGTFRLDDTDRVLALLAATLPLEVHYRTRYWVSLVPRTHVG
ncbi:DUF4880 domain-containing protein [Pseudomonas otitidis]|uniref:DUF4880 domain-containing protein n=1 Tax=Metapseudomonas otitidis TaxID=319939 RepID=A0ABU3XMF4_9GAMM|nr:DUF4880 domain-containing protein [Pseudomonas otitidis]MDV3439123.1 DUF4880 domain-containing protein [Pseudomonas otitidis]